MKSPLVIRLYQLTLAGAAALTLSSCVTTSTVQSRITERPEIYNALPASQRTLVDRGQIKEGMTKDSVYLAWGAPDNVREASSGGKRTETWLYESYKPVYTESVGVGGYGYGYGGYGGYSGYGRRRGYYDPYCDYGNLSYGSAVYYQPYTSSVVEFSGDKVKSWQRLR